MTILANNAVLAALRSGGPTQTLATAMLKGVHNVADYATGLTADSAAAATANTNAFIAACDALEAEDGGTLYVPPGTYYVGKQDSSAGNDTLGYSYRGYTIIKIDNCTKPVKIILDGVKLIMVAGLRYGSFDPLTGSAMATKQTASKYRAWLGTFVQMHNNTSAIEVVGPCELDGNIQNMVIGSEWGDTGHQLEAAGIEMRNSPIQTIRNVYAHHCGLDGFMTSYFWSLTREAGLTLLDNCIGNFNGRDGWSIIGGNKVTGLNCEFSWQGKNSDYTAATVSSSPCAGIDIENEVEAIRNVTLINVKCIGNTNTAIVSDAGNTEDVRLHDCLLVGSGTAVLWPGTRGWKLINCKVIGRLNDVHSAASPEDGMQAYGTIFSTRAADFAEYPGSITLGSGGLGLLTSGNYCYFDGCTFAGEDMQGFQAGASGASVMSRFNNCNILIDDNDTVGTKTVQGFFTGRTILKTNGSPFSTGNGRNDGEFVVTNAVTGESHVSYGRGKVVAVTASRSIRFYESGTTYTNEGATALRTHTLPTASVNIEYSWYVQNSFGLKVTAASGDTIRIKGGVTAAAGSVQSTNVGDTLTLKCINATEWVATEVFGSWGLAATTTVDPASLAAGGRTTPATLTVTGAVLGDIVDASFSLDLQGAALNVYVSAANTVTYYFQNDTAGTVDLASGTLKVLVRKT